MADRGPLPRDLQKKKINVEIRRLEHQIEHDEMRIMEVYAGIAQTEENIAAAKKEMEKQKTLLKNFEGPEKEATING